MDEEEKEDSKITNLASFAPLNSAEGVLPTINFSHFASLLSPSNVEICICCSTPLLQAPPPKLNEDKKKELLQDFCDILNIPFSERERNGDEKQDKEEVDGTVEEAEKLPSNFPFCLGCTNKKVLVMSMMHQRLTILQEQLDKLKETVMQDIVRGFVTSMVHEKKVPVDVIRKSRISHKMFHLFKRHSERRRRKDTLDNETQTDISSVNTQLMQPSAVKSLLEKLEAERKRKGPAMPVNSGKSNGIMWRNKRSTSNKLQLNSYDKKNSPVKTRSPNTHNSTSYYGTRSTSRNNFPLENVEESVASFDEQLNGGLFPFDDQLFGANETGAYTAAGFDYPLLKSTSSSNINGFSTIITDDEFKNVLGIGLGNYEDISDTKYTPPSNLSTEANSTSRGSRKRSPITYTDLSNVGIKSEAAEGSQSHQTRPKNGNRTRSKARVTCEVCNTTMAMSAFKRHMDKIHGVEKPHECRGCEKRFSRRDHFMMHEEVHLINPKRPYFCHRCVESNELIIGKSSYIDHCMSKHGIEDNVVECFYFCDANECLESYKVKEDFHNHVKSHWAIGESFICEVCEKHFATNEKLLFHETGAHKNGQPYYDCQFCYKGFPDENNFSCHLLFHQVKIPPYLEHACTKCDKRFETLTQVRRHKYKAHVFKSHGRGKRKLEEALSNNEDSTNSNLDYVEQDSTLDKIEFVCKKCCKSFSTEKNLEKHYMKHPSHICAIPNGLEKASSEEETPDAGAVEAENDDNDYVAPRPKRRRNTATVKTLKPSDSKQCSQCDKNLSSKQELRRHMIMAHKVEFLKPHEVFCVVCFNVFNTQEELNLHCDERHSKFQCPICNQQQVNSLSLKQHIQRFHETDRPFVCTICNSGFASKSSLSRHFSKAHKGINSEAINNSEGSFGDSSSHNYENDDESTTYTPNMPYDSNYYNSYH